MTPFRLNLSLLTARRSGCSPLTSKKARRRQHRYSACSNRRFGGATPLYLPSRQPTAINSHSTTAFGRETAVHSKVSLSPSNGCFRVFCAPIEWQLYSPDNHFGPIRVSGHPKPNVSFKGFANAVFFAFQPNIARNSAFPRGKLRPASKPIMRIAP